MAENTKEITRGKVFLNSARPRSSVEEDTKEITQGQIFSIRGQIFSIYSTLIYTDYIYDGDSDKYILNNYLGKYDTLINSALFEHLTTRESFDEINDCVADTGCMIIHTRICGNIPNDANWFYLKPPVHCAFHTNKSMEILMGQWGYKSSIYCPSSRSWILFKKEFGDYKKKIDLINSELQSKYLFYKEGFVDYWKTF